MESEPNFHIEPPDWSKELSALRKLAGAPTTAVQPLDVSAVREFEQKVNVAFCEIAIHAWRAERRMKDKTSGEVKEEHKPTHRSIAGILETLKGLGFELRDREGESYDYGLPEKVVAAEKRVGLSRELVAETIRPSVFVHGQLAWPGEIIIAVPETPTEAEAKGPA